MKNAIKLNSVKDNLVIEIVRQLHPYDLGKETSEIENIIYTTLEKFVIEDSNLLKYSIKK